MDECSAARSRLGSEFSLEGNMHLLLIPPQTQISFHLFIYHRLKPLNVNIHEYNFEEGFSFILVTNAI